MVGTPLSVFVKAYAECSQMPLVAVCDTDGERAMEIGRCFGVPHVYTDLVGIVDHPDLDLVSIHTPDRRHTEPVLRLVECI